MIFLLRLTRTVGGRLDRRFRLLLHLGKTLLIESLEVHLRQMHRGHAGTGNQIRHIGAEVRIDDRGAVHVQQMMRVLFADTGDLEMPACLPSTRKSTCSFDLTVTVPRTTTS